MTGEEAALKFVNQQKEGHRGRPRTKLPKAPLSSDPVTVALEPFPGANTAEKPKKVQAFIDSFKAGRQPQLVAG